MKNKDHNQGLSILIVDDDPEMYELIGLILRRRNHLVDFASNGSVALKKLFMNHYDVLITDVMMPDMDGYELIRIVRTNKTLDSLELQPISVILCTSKGSINPRVVSFDFVIDGYITKPFPPNELTDLIKSITEKKYPPDT